MIGFCLTASILDAQELFRSVVDGEVTDIRSAPVPYVHVLITSRGEGAVGDYEGRFRIAAYPGDTLRFSSVSYKNAFVKIPDSLHVSRFKLHVTLVGDTTVLSEISIYPWPGTYKEFEKEFVELELVAEPNPALEFPMLAGKELKNIAFPTGGIRVQGPVSLLYEAFGKRPKSLRLRNSLVAEDRKKEQILMKYNPIVISRITGLTDPDEINAFVKFCRLPDVFILYAKEYTLYKAILDCYREYR